MGCSQNRGNTRHVAVGLMLYTWFEVKLGYGLVKTLILSILCITVVNLLPYISIIAYYIDYVINHRLTAKIGGYFSC